MQRYRVSRPPINSPAFNLREITKQMLLLEDHLSDDDKYCVDCIRKHFLVIEALAEESLTLDSTRSWGRVAADVARLTRRWQVSFIDGAAKESISQSIRKKRKELVELVFDPRI
jgi:hypothetical protein